MRNAEKQPEVVRFVTGIDQSNGTRGGPPGTFELIKNMRFQSGGLQKRCGSAAIPSTADTYRALADKSDSDPRPTEKAAFIGRLGDSRIAAASSGHAFLFDANDDEQYSGEFSAATPIRKRFGIAPGLAAQAVGPYMPSVATNANGYVVTAAAFGPALRITVESPDGTQIYSFTEAAEFATNGVVRVVPISTTQFYVLSQDIADTALEQRLVTISASTGQASIAAVATLVTLANAASCWDVSPYDGTTWFLVYQSAATTVTISERNSSGTQVDSVTFTSADNQTYLSIWADPVTDRIWIGLVDDITGTPAAAFRVYTDALDLSVGPTTFANTGGVPLFGPLYKRTPVAGDAFCVFAESSTSPSRSFTVAAVIQAGSLTREEFPVGNVIPISKPDIQQRVWCMTHGTGANFQTAKVVLLRFAGDEFIGESGDDPTPVIELASPDFEDGGSTYHPFAQPGRAFSAVSVTSEAAGGKAYFAFPFVVTSRTNASGTKEPTHRVDVYEYTRYNQEPHRQFATLGRVGFVAGQPTELWGQMQVHTASRREHGGAEIGFAHAPIIARLVETPNAGGVAVGSYLYFAVHQWVDDEGNRHLSAPSAPFALTLTVPTSVEVEVLTCTAGQRRDMSQSLATGTVPILIYRTQNGGTEAQMVPVSPIGPGGGGVGSYLEFTDTVADSVIDDNEFIYTAGGVLPNVLAPSCRYLAVSEERLWCGGLWDSNIIECSKVRVPSEPFNFTGHPSHQVVIPGEVSGLAYMDGQVCVFTEDAIYLVSGDGPNDQGAGGFAPPRALVRGIGCPREQSASILETEAGILFRSTMGFYAIPRGFGTPQYIGDKVQDENPLVLSAATTTTSDNRLARFLVASVGGTKSNKVLSLDLTNMQWIRDEYTVDGAVITGQGFSEIGEWPDGLALMSYGLDRADNPNVIWAEDEDLTGDAGAAGVSATTYISQYARTNWASIAGPTGLMRCSEVVAKMEPIGSSSAVTMTVETDRNSAQALTWTISNSNAVEYRSIVVKEQQCTEFRVTVEDAAGAANSAGVRLLALGLEVGPIPGIRRGTDSEGG